MILARLGTPVAPLPLPREGNPPATKSTLPTFKSESPLLGLTSVFLAERGKPMFHDRIRVRIHSPAISWGPDWPAHLGNNMALNSAPTRMINEIMYIHTSNAMPTPSEP